MQDNEVPSTQDNTTEPSKPPQLLEIELRVLGVLMEKQLTTPDAYPLTLNSIITACNQKSSRDPVTNYHQGEVSRALRELEDRHFVRREHGSRSERYDQQFMNHLGLGKKQQALLCVMMLRGPQTISELSTRTKRMCEFVDKEDLELCIDRLSERQPACAIRLGQQPGQRGERVAHLFAGKPAVQARTNDTSTHAVSASGDMAQTITDSSSNNTSENNEATTHLEMELATLKEQVSALNAETNTLKMQLNTLYELTGNNKPDNDTT